MADNLSLPVVASSQNQKEVTINAATQQLSGALADYLSCDLSVANYTLSAANLRAYIGFVTSGNAAPRNFTLPAQKRALFYIQNGGSATVSVICGSTTLSLPAGAVGFFQTDGTTNGLISVAPVALGGEVDIGLCCSGKPNDSEVIAYVFNEAVTLPASLTGTHFFVGTNPGSTAVIHLYKVSGGTPTLIGSLSIDTSGGVTVTFASDINFAIGDSLKMVMPSPQDSAFADFTANYKFTKS